jgi:hypothetical protein
VKVNRAINRSFHMESVYGNLYLRYC